MGANPVGLVRIAAPDPAAGSHPDLALAQAVLRKDRKATAELVDSFAGPVYSYIRARLAPRLEAVDDLVQDVFVAAWQYLPAYGGSSPLRSWILGIARHKVEDHYRRRLRQCDQWDESGPEPPGDGGPPVDEAIDQRRETERARRILAELPEHYATVLLWRYWEQRSTREIAEAVGRSEKAVERMLARARDNFRRRWLDG